VIFSQSLLVLRCVLCGVFSVRFLHFPLRFLVCYFSFWCPLSSDIGVSVFLLICLQSFSLFSGKGIVGDSPTHLIFVLWGSSFFFQKRGN